MPGLSPILGGAAPVPNFAASFAQGQALGLEKKRLRSEEQARTLNSLGQSFSIIGGNLKAAKDKSAQDAAAKEAASYFDPEQDIHLKDLSPDATRIVLSASGQDLSNMKFGKERLAAKVDETRVLGEAETGVLTDRARQIGDIAVETRMKGIRQIIDALPEDLSPEARKKASFKLAFDMEIPGAEMADRIDSIGQEADFLIRNGGLTVEERGAYMKDRLSKSTARDKSTREDRYLEGRKQATNLAIRFGGGDEAALGEQAMDEYANAYADDDRPGQQAAMQKMPQTVAQNKEERVASDKEKSRQLASQGLQLQRWGAQLRMEIAKGTLVGQQLTIHNALFAHTMDLVRGIGTLTSKSGDIFLPDEDIATLKGMADDLTAALKQKGLNGSTVENLGTSLEKIGNLLDSLGKPPEAPPAVAPPVTPGTETGKVDEPGLVPGAGPEPGVTPPLTVGVSPPGIPQTQEIAPPEAPEVPQPPDLVSQQGPAGDTPAEMGPPGPAPGNPYSRALRAYEARPTMHLPPGKLTSGQFKLAYQELDAQTQAGHMAAYMDGRTIPADAEKKWIVSEFMPNDPGRTFASAVSRFPILLESMADLIPDPPPPGSLPSGRRGQTDISRRAIQPAFVEKVADFLTILDPEFNERLAGMTGGIREQGPGGEVYLRPYDGEDRRTDNALTRLAVYQPEEVVDLAKSILNGMLKESGQGDLAIDRWQDYPPNVEEGWFDSPGGFASNVANMFRGMGTYAFGRDKIAGRAVSFEQKVVQALQGDQSARRSRLLIAMMAARKGSQ